MSKRSETALRINQGGKDIIAKEDLQSQRLMRKTICREQEALQCIGLNRSSSGKNFVEPIYY